MDALSRLERCPKIIEANLCKNLKTFFCHALFIPWQEKKKTTKQSYLIHVNRKKYLVVSLCQSKLLCCEMNETLNISSICISVLE